MARWTQLQVPHSLDQDAAHERVRALGDYYQNRHRARVSWQGYEGRIVANYLVITIEAKVRVEPHRIDIRGRVPRMLLKTAMNYLNNKVRRYLSPETPLDELPRR